MELMVLNGRHCWFMDHSHSCKLFFFFLIKALASCYSKGKILVYILILTSLLSHNWIFLLDPKLTEFMAIATLNAK